MFIDTNARATIISTDINSSYFIAQIFVLIFVRLDGNSINTPIIGLGEWSFLVSTEPFIGASELTLAPLIGAILSFKAPVIGVVLLIYLVAYMG